eukprot:g8681.t1
MKKKSRGSVFGFFNVEDREMVAEDNNVAAKKKKLSWLQGEFDQLTNRLMDFIVPRAVEDGGKSLEFADVEMQKNPLVFNSSGSSSPLSSPTNSVSGVNLDPRGTQAKLISVGQKIFSGKDVVDALLRGVEANSREDGVVLGGKLLNLGYLEEQSRTEAEEAARTEVTDDTAVTQTFREESMYKYALNNQRVMAIIYTQLQETTGDSADNLMRHFRQMVSLKKIRYVRDGFDLDLTYITRKIIAMGFPSSALEGMYRNPMEEVQRFFDQYHAGHFKIYNLCSERKYDPEMFNGAVAHWPFDDHNPCPLKMIGPFCKSISSYLREDNRNTVAVHCKAGKGRTGLMVCAYLLHCGAAKTAQEATHLFAKRRTHNEKGVTIPSQIRYVNYYERIVRNLAPPVDPEVEWVLSEISFHPIPFGGCTPSFTVAVNGETVFKSTDHMKSSTYMKTRKSKVGQVLAGGIGGSKLSGDEASKFVAWKRLEFFNVRFSDKDDIRFRFKDAASLGTKTKLFHCWLNAQFITDFDGDGNMRDITLPKNELDDAIKDKKCSIFPDNFKLRLRFRKVHRQPSDFRGRKATFDVNDLEEMFDDKRDDAVFMHKTIGSLMNISKILSEKAGKIDDIEALNKVNDGLTYQDVEDEINVLEQQMLDLNTCTENLSIVQQNFKVRLGKLKAELKDLPVDEVML